MNVQRRTFLASMVTVAGLGVEVLAVSPTPFTAIQVDDMHCADCAKKIASKLYSVPGVVEVRADVGKSVAYVVPQKDKSVSPKALWEAVEKAGFKPVKLEGPSGAFTKKPKA